MNALFFLFVGICANSIAAIKSNDSSCKNGSHDSKIPSIHAMLVRDRYIANEMTFDPEFPIGEKAIKLPYPRLIRMLIQFNAINGNMKSRISLVNNGKPVFVVHIKNETFYLNANKKDCKPDKELTRPLREQFLKLDFYKGYVQVSQIIFQTGKGGPIINEEVYCESYMTDTEYPMKTPALLVEIECETTIVKKILTESMSIAELPSKG